MQETFSPEASDFVNGELLYFWAFGDLHYRARNQWHTMTRTGKVAALMKAAPEPYLEIHAEDAAKAGVVDGGFVEVRSRRGMFVAQARVTAEVPRGVCFAPFHWGRSAGDFKAANNLTQRTPDPISKQPELKFCVINVTPHHRLNEVFANPVHDARSFPESSASGLDASEPLLAPK